jgi:uncharacterized spore protein YtfJ
MKMANDLNTTVSSLFQGMDKFLTTKTVVGEPQHLGDTILVPLVDVSFGVAAGAFTGEHKNNGAGGMGGKMSASAVLVIRGDQIRLVNVKNQDTITKLIDMVPDLMDRFKKKDGEDLNSEEIDNAVDEILENN